MSNLKKIIEATLAQKPLTVKETIDEIMAEKCRAIVDNIQPEFGNAVMEEQEEAAEMQNFFEAFHADHGDKPIEEQFEIMEAFEAELAEKKKIDHDKDGDNDFNDVKIARMIASGMSKEEALEKVKKAENHFAETTKSGTMGNDGIVKFHHTDDEYHELLKKHQIYDDHVDPPGNMTRKTDDKSHNRFVKLYNDRKKLGVWTTLGQYHSHVKDKE